jgi:hypothetical protein
MIVYDLQCRAGHRFEAWFGSSQDFDDQQARGLLTCPLCGDTHVAKAAMAPAIPAKANRQPSRPEDAASMASGDALEQLLMLQRAFEAGSDYVGDRFAQEARAIHRAGEDRRVHGEATAAEVKALREEGVPLLPLPFRPRARSDA